MNAREAANVERWAAEDAAGPCLLCGGRVLALQLEGEWVAYELCGTCNGAFQDLANALGDAAAQARAAGRLEAAPVAGQLELEDGGEEYELDVDAVMAAVRAGQMGGVNTMDLGTVLHHLPGLAAWERDIIRAELGRRS